MQKTGGPEGPPARVRLKGSDLLLATEDAAERTAEDAAQAARAGLLLLGRATGEHAAEDAAENAAEAVSEAASDAAKKAGCGSFIGGGLIVLVTVLGSAWIAKRK